MFGRPASLHRVPVDGQSPCFTGRLRLPFGTTRTLRLPATLPAAASFSFAMDGTTVAPAIRSLATADAPLRGPGCWGERPPVDAAIVSVEMAESPKFPHRPLP